MSPCRRSSRREPPGPARDALLVYRLPAGTALSEADAADISDATLDDLYRQLLTLRRARIAHGAISGDTLLVDPAAETVVLADFRNASVERVAGSARPGPGRRHGGDGSGRRRRTSRRRRGTVPARRRCSKAPCGICTAPALDPALGRSLRGKRGLLEDVRQRAARATSIDVPKLVEPRRVSWPTLIMVIGTLIGGWALIGVLIDVSKSFDTVIGADWLWVIMAFVLAQLAYRRVGRGRHRQRGRAAAVRAGGGGRGRQRVQRAGRRDRGGLRHPGALLPAAGLRRLGGAELGRHHGHRQLDRHRGAVPGARCRSPGGPSTSRPPPSRAGTRNWCGSSWPWWCWSPWWPAWCWPCPGCAGWPPRRRAPSCVTSGATSSR